MPRSNFRELEKIPSMISHFQEHKGKTAGNLTFSEFLVLHFSLASDHHEPSHETELPLHNGVAALFLFTLPAQWYFDASPGELAIKHFKPFSVSYHFLYASAWFQPPQQA